MFTYLPDIFSQKTPLQPPSSVDPTPYNINAYQSQNVSKFGFRGYHTNPGYWSPQQYDADYNKKVYRPNVGPNFGSNHAPNLPNNVAVYNQNFFNTPPNFYPNFNNNDWIRPAASVAVTHYNPNEWWK